MVTVSIGKPISSTGVTPEELNAIVFAWIEQEMQQLNPERFPAQNTSHS